MSSPSGPAGGDGRDGYVLVDSVDQWPAVTARLRSAPRVAVDVEADGFHRYPERVALIQVAIDDGTVWLLDPLAIADLGAMGEVLGDPRVPVIAHAAGYDVRSLHRDYGFDVRGLFDTAIAAQFCGARQTGLAHVADAVLGVRLAKTKRLQRTDWSSRPLAAEERAYAADDVRYLLLLADRLSARLEDLGRAEWVAEECLRQEAERFREPEPPEAACLSVAGARQLTDRGRAVLLELFLFREAEAIRQGRPPYRVASADALIQIAERPDLPLDQVGGLDRRLLGTSRSRLESAVRRGLTGPGIPWRSGQRREGWSRHAQTRLKQLKEWRTAVADELDLDPGIVWPVEHLRHLALHPESGSSADGSDGTYGALCVRQWQRKHLGRSLDAFRQERLADRLPSA